MKPLSKPSGKVYLIGFNSWTICYYVRYCGGVRKFRCSFYSKGWWTFFTGKGGRFFFPEQITMLVRRDGHTTFSSPWTSSTKAKRRSGAGAAPL